MAELKPEGLFFEGEGSSAAIHNYAWHTTVMTSGVQDQTNTDTRLQPNSDNFALPSSMEMSSQCL